MSDSKPILMTGMPRSGTTWVGRVIEQVPGYRYVHEPFNISRFPCKCGVRFNYWFHYLATKSQSEFQEHLYHTIFPAFHRFAFFNTLAEISQTRRIRPLYRYLQTYNFSKPVVKDPLAIFSVKQLADMFNLDVVILIRHPAAVVSSYKSLNWNHPFSHFLNQPELMEDHLAPFRCEIEDFANNPYDIVDQAALLWKLIYFMILKLSKNKPDWIFVRYKDLAQDPINGFQSMFNQLKLPFSKKISRVVQMYSPQTEQPDPTDPYSIRRSAGQVINKWKQELSSDEIARIRKRVEEVSSAFFADDEWVL